MLLLDEPLGALDLKLREQMQVELKAIQREVGITFLFVTHDQEEALTMSDRIAVFNDGRIEQVGTPAEVYEHPADRVRRRLRRHVEPARPATAAIQLLGTDGTFSVRPEKITLVDAREPGQGLDGPSPRTARSREVVLRRPVDALRRAPRCRAGAGRPATEHGDSTRPSSLPCGAAGSGWLCDRTHVYRVAGARSHEGGRT